MFNAGHLPPIILDHAGVRTLPRGNTAIGLMDGAPFDERQVDFEQDDVMVIYSDGVSEARSEGGVFFGDERLVRILRKARGQSASAVGAVILSEVADFVGDARPHDDLSIIVIRRRA